MKIKNKSLILLSALIGSVTVFAGGIDGGGGGTLVSDPITPVAVVKIIQNAQKELRAFVKAQEVNFHLNGGVVSKSLDPILFGGKSPTGEKLWDVLERTNIELLMDRACKDKNGQNVDASIYASKPGMICLSAFSIAPKLIEETARPQTEALILHELSHLLGIEEDEAIVFQKFAISSLKKIPSGELNEFLHEAWIRSNQTRDNAKGLVNAFDSISTQEIKEKLDWIAAQDMDLSQYLYSQEGRMSVMDYREIQLQNYYAIQLSLARVWLAIQLHDNSTGNANEYYNTTIFRNADSATYQEVQQRMGYPIASSNPLAKEPIRRIKSLGDLKEMLSSYAEYAHEVYIYAHRFYHDLRLQPMTGPWDSTPNLSQNPWFGLQGHYEIASIQCDDEAAQTPPYNVFEVIRVGGQAGRQLLLRKLGPNDYYTGIGLDEDHVVRVTRTLTALSNKGASYREEVGSLWAPYYSKKEYRLEQDRYSGAYKMTETDVVRDWDVQSGQIRESSHQCVYQLVRGPAPTEL